MRMKNGILDLGKLQGNILERRTNQLISEGMPGGIVIKLVSILEVKRRKSEKKKIFSSLLGFFNFV